MNSGFVWFSMAAPLFAGCAPLPILVDAQTPDLRFQRLSWNCEFCGCARRSGYSTMAVGESRFDHLDLAFRQR
jgi:hypothetical protein